VLSGGGGGRKVKRGLRGRLRGPCSTGSHAEVRGAECGARASFYDRAARHRRKREGSSLGVHVL
jgi:hypothetical protein